MSVVVRSPWADLPAKLLELVGQVLPFAGDRCKFEDAGESVEFALYEKTGWCLISVGDVGGCVHMGSCMNAKWAHRILLRVLNAQDKQMELAI